MAQKKLIIVESPTKARTIRKFVGKEYEVESCMGHLRDLPESTKEIPEKYKSFKWAKLGVNVDKDFEPIYCVSKSKQKVLSLLKNKSKDSSEIILATDEDREGESISWHLKEILKSKGKKFKRMVFHEITKGAILDSLKHFREIDQNLVNAQEARRILDRLVGYKISPVLWKKVARGLSAGRVQSVAVRLLSERELKRRDFKTSSFWSLGAELKKGNQSFLAQLVSYQNKDIVTHSDFDRNTGELKKTKKLLLDEKKSKKLISELKSLPFKVTDLKTQIVSKKPSPPFTTSTLQQESNRKLSLSAKETMSLAQQLYERGFITYMRTDSVFLSQQSLKASKEAVIKHFGKEFVSKEARIYKNKSKGAQEAHEAIRPAGDSFVHPNDSQLSGHLFKLYQMIWQRTLASQAQDCKQKRVTVQIEAGKEMLFTASGMQIQFEGYYKIYGYSDSTETFLPELKKGDALKCQKTENKRHETKAPTRFTEASLIQTLEKEGIGRPSTYAPIIATVQRRGYVFKDKNTLIPTITGIIVTQFLKEHFPDYVDTKLTSDMEQVLDEIAEGKKEHIQYLNQIYFGPKGLQKQVEKQEKRKDDQNTKSFKLNSIKGYTFFAGPWGAYVTRDTQKKESVSLPLNICAGDLTLEEVEELFNKKEKGNDELGKDPQTKQPIYVLNGRYGAYLQRGDLKEDKADVKKVSIPKSIDSDEIDLQTALKLLELPKLLGEHPKSKKEIKKGIGRFGPYVVCDGDFRSVRDIQVFFDLTLKDAVKILNEEKKKGKQKKVLKKIGLHPEMKDEILLLDGKYGPYIQHGKQRVSLPATVKTSSLDVKKALELLKFKKESSSKVSVKNGANVVKKRGGKVSLAGTRKKKSKTPISKRS